MHQKLLMIRLKFSHFSNSLSSLSSPYFDNGLYSVNPNFLCWCDKEDRRLGLASFSSLLASICFPLLQWVLSMTVVPHVVYTRVCVCGCHLLPHFLRDICALALLIHSLQSNPSGTYTVWSLLLKMHFQLCPQHLLHLVASTESVALSWTHQSHDTGTPLAGSGFTG